MKILVYSVFLISLTAFSQQPSLILKLDSTTQKYGYVNAENEFVIPPTFDEAYEFMSPYTSVKIDTLWGIIDTLGKFKVKPIYNKISAIYKGHFLEYGTENYKFRSIDGSIKYEYLFIPGPFKKISDSIQFLELEKLPDGELLLRVMEMTKTSCHYYERNRIFNAITLSSNLALKWTVEYILANPIEVTNWISNDKKFETAFKNGEIDCCGHGPVWYGK